MAQAEQPPQPAAPKPQEAAQPSPRPASLQPLSSRGQEIMARIIQQRTQASPRQERQPARTGLRVQPETAPRYQQHRERTTGVPSLSKRGQDIMARITRERAKASQAQLQEQVKRTSQPRVGEKLDITLDLTLPAEPGRGGATAVDAKTSEFIDLGRSVPRTREVRKAETPARPMPPESMLRALARAEARKKGVPVEQALAELRQQYSGDAQETRQATPVISITPEEVDTQEVSEEELRDTEEWAKEWLHGFISLQSARTPEEKEQYLVMIAQKVRQQRKLLDETYPRSLMYVPGFYGGVEGMDWEKQRTDLGMNTCQFAAVGNALRSLGVYDEERHSEEAFIRHLGGDTYVKSVRDANLIGASTGDVVRTLRELCPEVQVERTDSVHAILQAVQEGAAAVVPLLSRPSHVGSIPPKDRVSRNTYGQLYVPVVDPLSGVNDNFPIERLIKSDITLAPFPDASAGFIIRRVSPRAATEPPAIPVPQRRPGETVKGPGRSLDLFPPPLSLPPEPPPIREAPRRGFEAGGSSLASDAHPNENQDAMMYDDKKGFMAVFDGVGGEVGGAVAARIARDVFGRNLKELPQNASSRLIESTFKTATDVASTTMRAETSTNVQLRGMATCFAAAQVTTENGKQKVVYTQAGDSRLYIVKRDGTVVPLTEDEGTAPPDVARRLDHAKSEADIVGIESFWKARNMVRNLLSGYMQSLTVQTYEVQPDDVLLLGTTDGVHDNVAHQDLEQLVRQLLVQRNSAKTMADAITTQAQKEARSGGFRAKPDDITAMVLQLQQ